MKFINGNRKTRDQWNDNIVDTKTAFILEIHIHILMELTIQGKYNDSVSDSDTSQQFQSEN
jgi:hypothetical protein